MTVPESSAHTLLTPERHRHPARRRTSRVPTEEDLAGARRPGPDRRAGDRRRRTELPPHPAAQSALTQDSAPSGVRGWLREHRQEIRKEIAQTSADTIGIPVDELKADYKAGQSISEIATAHGVDPQTVADALVAKATDTLNQAVTDGKLSQERADKAEGRVPDLATRVIDHHKGEHQAKPAN
jgi:hypothetical protein